MWKTRLRVVNWSTVGGPFILAFLHDCSISAGEQSKETENVVDLHDWRNSTLSKDVQMARTTKAPFITFDQEQMT